MIAWDGDLRLAGSDLYLDARTPRPLCYVSHAHTDHLADHCSALLTKETALLAVGRVNIQSSQYFEYRKSASLSSDLRVTVYPAGHVLGSAMLHAETGSASLLYTGDFKLRPSPTCPPAEPCAADHLVMECTYGLPMFRFPDPASVEDQLVEKCRQSLAEGRQPIAFAYALGKAQHLQRVLTQRGIPVSLHGAVANVSDKYEALGVPLGTYRRYRPEDFHGTAALPLPERGVLIAPPGNTRSTFTTRFERRWTVMLSGWGMDPNARYRYGVDEVLPLSDHADHGELWETLERVNPKVVWLQHGFVREFVDELRSRGLDARPARPMEQLELF